MYLSRKLNWLNRYGRAGKKNKTVKIEIPGTENGEKTLSGQTVGRAMVCFEKKQTIKFDYKTILPPSLLHKEPVVRASCDNNIHKINVDYVLSTLGMSFGDTTQH